MNKTLIYIGVTAGSLLGSWLGSLLDDGKFLGIWGILLGGVGGIAGIWIAYKIGQSQG